MSNKNNRGGGRERKKINSIMRNEKQQFVFFKKNY